MTHTIAFGGPGNSAGCTCGFAVTGADSRTAALVAVADHIDAHADESRVCPNCGDEMPEGWTLDDHLNCNWPSDREPADSETGEQR